MRLKPKCDCERDRFTMLDASLVSDSLTGQCRVNVMSKELCDPGFEVNMSNNKEFGRSPPITTEQPA